MAKDDQDKKKKDKRGKANKDAWEAARTVAKAIRKERKQDEGKNEVGKAPWRAIREQLRRTGTVVDLDAMPPNWTSENAQMADVRRILEEAGFKRDGSRYVWDGSGSDESD